MDTKKYGLWEASPLKHGYVQFQEGNHEIQKASNHQNLQITDASSPGMIKIKLAPGPGPRSGRPKFSTFFLGGIRNLCRGLSLLNLWFFDVSLEWCISAWSDQGAKVDCFVGGFELPPWLRRSARWKLYTCITFDIFLSKSRGQEFAMEAASFDAQQLDMGTVVLIGLWELMCSSEYVDGNPRQFLAGYTP